MRVRLTFSVVRCVRRGRGRSPRCPLRTASPDDRAGPGDAKADAGLVEPHVRRATPPRHAGCV